MTPEGASTFPIARCAPCARDVLAHVTLDAADEERWGCVHCDASLDPAEFRWVTEDALDGYGYGLAAEREHCGRPDCGGGKCFRP